VACSNGVVSEVKPDLITVPVPSQTSMLAICNNTDYSGMSDVFRAGSTCDAETACKNYSDRSLVSKECSDSSMVFTKENGSRIERWSKK